MSKKTIIERLEISSSQLIDKSKELFDDVTATKLIIRNSDGNELLSIPLALGALGGGIMTFLLPRFAAIGAIGALVSKVKLDIVREVSEKEATKAINSGKAVALADETDDDPL
ncbi:MAG: DUF4342 domain-containing protein [Deinococcales bacterium]